MRLETSFEACPLFNMKNTFALRTAVAGVLEVVNKKRNQAAAKNQPVR